MKKAFFFDRDGVINVDHGYVSRAEEIDFTDGIFPVMRGLHEKGYELIIITNQSGIGRGRYTEETFRELTGWMNRRFAEEGICVSGVYYCPHTPEEQCSCRKPEPGLFLRALREKNLDPAASWAVGDRPRDLAAAEAAGIRNLVWFGGEDAPQGTHVISRLSELLELPV